METHHDDETTARPRRTYGRLWAGVPRELGFLLPLLPIVIVGLSVLASVFFTGVGMIFIVVGIFIVVASLFIARGFGMFELLRLRGAGFPPITAPNWDRVAPSRRLVHEARSPRPSTATTGSTCCTA